MSGVLELAQFVEADAVAQVDVGGGRVDTELDAQLAPGLVGGGQFRLEGALRKDLDGAHGKVCDETGIGHVVPSRSRGGGPQGRMIPQAPRRLCSQQ